jgi:hypothetical protein
MTILNEAGELDPPRFRDCMLVKDEESGELQIFVLTRTGGGNRECYESDNEDMQDHPCYISDRDAEFDCTYAEWFFRVPEKHKKTVEEVAAIAVEEKTPGEKFDDLVRRIEDSGKCKEA